ncbi:uracil-DNA glycosylase [bacterium]|nr:uracil-DNA glycosylase [bacterium]
MIIEKHPLFDFEEEIKNCKRCDLSLGRTNFVFGKGCPNADVLFVGEAPGEAEDLSGIPFIGRAGKLLDKMLEEISLEREDVFIANVLKCRPPENRDPKPNEIALCETYLHKQIEIIKPRIIIALGRIAGQTLLNIKAALKDMKGKTYTYRGVDLEVIYHPAAILRNMGLIDNYKADFHRLADKYDLRGNK